MSRGCKTLLALAFLVTFNRLWWKQYDRLILLKLSKWQRNKKTRFVQIVFLSPNSLISMVCNNTKSGYQIWIFPDKSSCSGNCTKYRFDSNRICLAALIILYHGTATQVVSITPFWPMHLKERIYEGLISFLTFFSQSILW